MSFYDENLNKRKLIAKAWINERNFIFQGKGTRNWNSLKQDYIAKFNRSICFIGQFCSNEMNEDNIQFLDFSMEYIFAHSGKNLFCMYGFFDTENYEAGNLIIERKVNIVNLSDCKFNNADMKRLMNKGKVSEFGIRTGIGEYGNNTNDSSQNSNNSDRKSKFGF